MPGPHGLPLSEESTPSGPAPDGALGGAMLEAIEGKVLPGIAAIQE